MTFRASKISNCLQKWFKRSKNHFEIFIIIYNDWNGQKIKKIVKNVVEIVNIFA